MNEQELIQLYRKKGDITAIRELFQRYEDRLFRYLWQMLRHQQDSEDALQETFRKALKAMPRYEERNQFKSWLFRIGHNTALNVIQKRKRMSELDEEASDILVADGRNPAEALAKRERTEVLSRAVNNLPESEREVVSLRMQAELSFVEISNLQRVPLGTVLARMHRAKEKLRVQLAGL
ncbi:MAG: sigma-70 family RNA polymerase sigma factor [Verrucomicrobiota bacterium]